MKNKITLIIFKNSYATAKQISISKYILFFFGLLVTLAIITYAHILLEYYQLNKVAAKNASFKAIIVRQDAEITSQRKQIQAFAKDLNVLNTKLAQIRDFEQKIRIIANMAGDKQDSPFLGVGGTLPSDTDPQMALNDSHSILVREMHTQMKDLKSLSHRQIDSYNDLLGRLKERRNLLASTPAIRPTTGWITSRFGYRKSPFTSRREFHKGLDIATRKGSPVIAAANGVIIYSGKKGLLGNLVVIDHGFGMVTRYGHLSKTLVKKGTKVKRGDKIGLVGNTGRSTGPHLHYEVHLNGVKVNPIKYILN